MTPALKHSNVILRPDPSRTVITPFAPGDPAAFAGKGVPRGQRIAERVMAPDGEVEIALLSPHAVPPQIVPGEGDEADSFWLVCDDSRQLPETVLFPVAPSQKQGIEDLRLVNFTSAARSELLEANSF